MFRMKRDVVASFPEQIKSAGRLGTPLTLTEYSDVVICGMGGSAIAGSIVEDYMNSYAQIPVRSCYDVLPRSTSEDSLVVIISYSGNTHEMTALYEQAKKKTENIAIITSGGVLAKKRPLQKVIVPEGFAPREAFAYLFIPLLRILGVSYDEKKIVKTLLTVDHTSAKHIANQSTHKTPLFYGPKTCYRSVMYRWKTQFNENAKFIAHSGVFPEANHNEVEAMDTTRFTCVLLKETDDYMPAETFLKPYIVPIKGTDLLSRLFYAIHFGDWVSYYAAEKKKRSGAISHIDFVKEYYARKKSTGKKQAKKGDTAKKVKK